MARVIKQIVKRSLQTLLAYLGPQRLHWGDGQLLVMMYHRVLPDDHPDRVHEQPGMYVSPQTFEMHMQELKARFELVKLEDWLKKAQSGQALPKRACAITFDDGWHDNYEFAYPILQRYQVPATIFVVSEYVGTHYSFWPNRLARVLAETDAAALKKLLSADAGRWLHELDLSFDLSAQVKFDQACVDEVIESAKSLSEQTLYSKLQAMESALGAAKDVRPPDMMSWVQLQEMMASGLVQIGSHTCRHTRLISEVDINIVKEEVEKSKLDLQDKLGHQPALFCYPNGDNTPESVELVKQNYLAACTTRRGWNTVKSNPWLLKRIGVHEDVAADRTAFLARLSGWL